MQIMLKFVTTEWFTFIQKEEKFSFTSREVCLPDRMTVLALGFKLLEP